MSGIRLTWMGVSVLSMLSVAACGELAGEDDAEGISAEDEEGPSPLLDPGGSVPRDPQLRCGGGGPPQPPPRIPPTTPPSPPRGILPPSLIPHPAPVPAGCGHVTDGMDAQAYQHADGTRVWMSKGNFAVPARSAACDRLFLGNASRCGTYRFAVWNPVSGVAFGPWVDSCSTPQALVPGEMAWPPAGKVFWIEQKLRTCEVAATQFTLYL